MPLSMRRVHRASSYSDMRRPGPKISSPVMQSTTNLHLNEMMDLQSAQRMMATRISIDTNRTHSPSTSNEPELTDGSSVSSSPTIEHSHLSTYFPGPAGAAAKATDSPAPQIPQRVPSHSKREHERMARKRSLRSNSGGLATITSPVSAPPSAMAPPSNDRSSFAIMGGNAPPANIQAQYHQQRQAQPQPAPQSQAQSQSQPLPKLITPATKAISPRFESGTLGPFTPELQRLTEALEEQFRVPPQIEDEDTLYMRQRGLIKLDVSAYCADIGLCNPFPETPMNTGFHHIPMGVWI